MKFDDLNDKSQKFIDFYLDTGDRDEAYRLAGYSIAGRAWKKNARMMFLKFEILIEERVETRIGEGALLALSVIRNLMTSAKSETVKLKAAQDYLHRGGRDHEKTEHEQPSKDADLTDEELHTEIQSLVRRMSIGNSTLQ